MSMMTPHSPNRSQPENSTLPAARAASPATVRRRRRRPSLLGLVVAALLLLLWPAACSLGSGRVVARVGEQEVTAGELERMLVLRAGPALLLEMVDSALINQAAAAAHITLTANEQSLKYNQAVARVGSEPDLNRRLQALHRTPAEYQAALRDDALLDRLALRSLKLTPADLQQYYQLHLAEFSHGEQVRGRLILFTSRDNAAAVAAALKSPEADFAGLAKAFSEDPATRDKGGDTGFFERKDYAAEISNVAFSLKPGEVSPLFPVPDGFALFKLEARRPAGAQAFADVAGALRSRLELERLGEARQAWLRQARAHARLVIPDAELQRQVRLLIAADTPFDPTNITPELPTAPR